MREENAEARHRLRLFGVGQRLPVAALKFERLVVCRKRNREDADTWLALLREFPSARAVPKPHLHVALSRANPDFADKYVLKLLLRRARDLQFIRTARWHRGQRNLETPFAVSDSRCAFTIQRCADLRACRVPPPDDNRLVALQHSMIAEDWRRHCRRRQPQSNRQNQQNHP